MTPLEVVKEFANFSDSVISHTEINPVHKNINGFEADRVLQVTLEGNETLEFWFTATRLAGITGREDRMFVSSCDVDR